jgi:hypothetical protein
VLVPLSHVIKPVLVLPCGKAGTNRSTVPLAGKPKLSVYPSDEYVHWDATPLRSVTWKVTPATPGSADTSGPCIGAGGGGVAGGGAAGAAVSSGGGGGGGGGGAASMHLSGVVEVQPEATSPV